MYGRCSIMHSFMTNGSQICCAFPYRLTSSMQATHQKRRSLSQGESLGARRLVGRHSFQINTGRAVLPVRVRWFTRSPVGHSREQAS